MLKARPRAAISAGDRPSGMIEQLQVQDTRNGVQTQPPSGGFDPDSSGIPRGFGDGPRGSGRRGRRSAASSRPCCPRCWPGPAPCGGPAPLRRLDELRGKAWAHAGKSVEATLARVFRPCSHGLEAHATPSRRRGARSPTVVPRKYACFFWQSRDREEAVFMSRDCVRSLTVAALKDAAIARPYTSVR
jgi:hypothetical protein